MKTIFHKSQKSNIMHINQFIKWVFNLLKKFAIKTGKQNVRVQYPSYKQLLKKVDKHEKQRNLKQVF